MPYETVQYPKPPEYDFQPNTELSVHWTKDSHVQLRVERHTDQTEALTGGGILSGLEAAQSAVTSLASAFTGVQDPAPMPPVVDKIPCGTVKVADKLGVQVAVKTRSAMNKGHINGNESSFERIPAEWTVYPPGGKFSDEDVESWRIVHFGDGKHPPVEVFTDRLSRSEINKLIRTLRKARDDAYGADA